MLLRVLSTGHSEEEGTDAEAPDLALVIAFGPWTLQWSEQGYHAASSVCVWLQAPDMRQRVKSAHMTWFQTRDIADGYDTGWRCGYMWVMQVGRQVTTIRKHEAR